MRGGEGKVHSAVICLKPSELEELRELWPEIDSTHVSVAQMRLLAQKYHRSTTIFHTNADGTETRIRAGFEYVVGDVKSLCIHLGQDNKCPLCTARYERYHCELYAGEPRDAEFNKTCWLKSKSYIAAVFAMASVNEDFSKFFELGTLCRTAEQLSSALAELEGVFRLSLTVAAFVGHADSLGQPGSLGVVERVKNFVEAYAEERAEQPREGLDGEDERLVNLRAFSTALPSSLPDVKEQLGGIRGESLLGFIACLATPGVQPELEDFTGARPGNQLKDVWLPAAKLSKTARAFGETLDRFRTAVRGAQDMPSVWGVLGTRGIPGLGFKEKGEVCNFFFSSAR